MHYKDIKKLTGNGHYCVDVEMRYLPEKVKQEISELRLQLEPDFQRGHVWTTEQRIAYMEFLIRGGSGANELLFNHPGWMGNWKGDFVLVDGLQRLTTILAFMKDELPVFGGHVLSQIEDSWRILHDVGFKWRVNNLKTRAEVLRWYIELNAGGTPHSKMEIERVSELLKKEENQ